MREGERERERERGREGARGKGERGRESTSVSAPRAVFTGLTVSVTQFTQTNMARARSMVDDTLKRPSRCNSSSLPQCHDKTN